MEDSLSSKLSPFFPSLREIAKTQSVLSSGDDFYAGRVHRLHIYIKIVELSTSQIGYTLPLQKGEGKKLSRLTAATKAVLFHKWLFQKVTLNTLFKVEGYPFSLFAQLKVPAHYFSFSTYPKHNTKMAYGIAMQV